MKERKKKKWMDSEDSSGNNATICLFKPSCPAYKKERMTMGRTKVRYWCCVFPSTCNQQRRTTIKQIILDYLKSKNNHAISNLIKRVKDTISKPSS